MATHQSNPSADRIEQQKALVGVIARIRESLDLETIFKTTATEVRQLLAADRVGVFRFDPDFDWEGEFVSEDVREPWDSVLEAKVHDRCFSENFAIYYQQGRSQALADIHEAGLKDCYIEILSRFSIRANLVVPLLQGQHLWGLLCIHQCGEPRHWQESEIEFVRQIGEHLSVALQHSQLLAQARDLAEQQKALMRVIANIREALDIQSIFKIAATEVRQLLKADRVAVFRFYPDSDWEGEFVSEDVGESWDSALAAKVYDHCFGQQFASHYQQGRIQAVADIYNAGLSTCHINILSRFAIRANLVVPVLKGQQLWGLFCIHHCSGPHPWQESEIDFVKQIADHFAVALQQAEYLVQLHSQSARLVKATAREKTLTATLQKIRQSLDLETIFQTATQQIRQLLQADRVVIYRFNPDWSGAFASESVAEGWTSLMQMQLERPEICRNINECSVKHLARRPVADTYLQETSGGNFARDITYRICYDIQSADFSDCYVELLESLEARAYVIIAIYHDRKLWGLLAAYQNSGPRNWQADEVELLLKISMQLGVAIQQAEYLQQVEVKSAELAKAVERQKAAERQKIIAAIVDKIRKSLDIDTIFETATSEIQQLLKADRVTIYRFLPDWSGEFVAESVMEGWTPLVGTGIVEDTFLQETRGGRYARNETFAVDDIYRVGHSDCHIKLLEKIGCQAYAIAPVFQGKKLWGLLAAYQNSSSRCWQADEVDLLAQISTQLGVALQQAEYLKQVQVQSAELAKAAERQRALATTVEKIRQSLDIKTIFDTTTQEVRRLLEVERVAIYRFYADWSGEFVADSLVDDWTPVLQKPAIFDPVFLRKTRAGKYPRNETFVPILQGEKLWGLLMAYQSSQPRYWQDEEINLLAQVGVQLGVALQQAELLEQTRRQTQELTRALQNLQLTQSQLIRGENMANLGQLVASAAREINNPINFIYDSLNQIDKYIRVLLDSATLYAEADSKSRATRGEPEESDIGFILTDLPRVLDLMKMGADRIRSLLLSLRTFSQFDETQMKPVDIHEIINSSLVILQHRLNSQTGRAIEVVRNYGDLPLVECYAAQLNQVFANILSDRIDALENSSVTSPKIQIHTELIGSNVAIRIADNGPGMSEDARSRIFDPFFTTDEVGKGTGLGLSISYQIVVKKHRGQLDCISQSGEGTEFAIAIPSKQVGELS